MKAENKKTKTYQRSTAEFKEEAVRLVRSGGTITRVATNLNINRHTLESWVRKSKALENKSSMKNEKGKTMLEIEAENKRLLKEVDYLQRANKVLKLASAFFSQDQLENDMRNLKK